MDTALIDLRDMLGDLEVEVAPYQTSTGAAAKLYWDGALYQVTFERIEEN